MKNVPAYLILILARGLYYFLTEVRKTLGFETETETWVVSVSVSRLETNPLKTESQSRCLRPQIKSLSISLTV